VQVVSPDEYLDVAQLDVAPGGSRVAVVPLNDDAVLVGIVFGTGHVAADHCGGGVGPGEVDRRVGHRGVPTRTGLRCGKGEGQRRNGSGGDECTTPTRAPHCASPSI
jgi:hypothetical protein